MTEPAFKPGDVVRMKRIAGPYMTIESVRPNKDVVHTVWFDPERHVHRDCFDVFALELAPDKEPRT